MPLIGTMGGLQNAATSAVQTPSLFTAQNAAMGFTGLSSLFGTLGSLEQGQFRRQQMQFQARVAEMQAENTIERGKEAESEYRGEVRKIIGKQRSSYAAQGVEINADTAMDVQAETAYIGEMDALTIRSNAMREAFGYRLQATGYNTNARLSMNQALDQSGATLLTGGMQIVDMWKRFGG